MLSCGIVGLPLVGKTTLFNLLTRLEAESSPYAGKTNTGIAPVPDARLDFLAQLYRPRKVVPAALKVIDVPGLVPGSGSAFLSAVREADALIHVVRAFQNPEVPHIKEEISPLRDLDMVNMELFVADLQMVENRLERLARQKKIKGEHLREKEALERCRQLLELEMPLSSGDLTEGEWEAIKHMEFLTLKPMMVVVNLDERQLAVNHYPDKEGIENYCLQKGIPLLEICLALEREIFALEPEERQIFLREMGIEEPGVNLLIKALYRRLGLISFFTVGENEVRAWTIKEGTDAKSAAGKIHSDMERGFIRAEVVNFQVLKELGDMGRVKEKGLLRLEGKEYKVKDGDIIHFRFNV